eukprot:1718382-Lingulodinium_polyedra.AAC.1
MHAPDKALQALRAFCKNTLLVASAILCKDECSPPPGLSWPSVGPSARATSAMFTRPQAPR